MTDQVEAIPGSQEDSTSVRAAADAINSLIKGGSPSILDNNMEPLKAQTKEPPVVEAAPAETPVSSEQEKPQASDDAQVDHQGVPEAKEAPVVAEAPAAPTQAVPQAPIPTEADKQLSTASQLASHLQYQLSDQFSDVKSMADLGKLATSANPEDVSRYNKYVWLSTQLNAAQQNVVRLSSEKHQAWYSGEQAKLQKALPDFFDPVKGPAIKTELRAYAAKNGFSEAAMQQADANQVMMLHKAMQFEKAQASKPAALEAAKAKAAKAPPVQKPGTPRDGTKEQADKAMEAFTRLRKTGDVRDAAAVMRTFL